MATAPKQIDLIVDAPPSSVDAERAVLGAIILTPNLLSQAREIIRPEWLYLASHQRIYRAFLTLAEAGAAIDTLTISEELRRTGHFEAIGGMSYIASLMDCVPRLENLGDYAAIVRDKACLRALLRAGNDLVREATQAAESADVLAGRYSERLRRIGDRAGVGEVESVGALAREMHDAIENPTHSVGVAWGFHALDELTNGIGRGDLWYLAAATSVGKTSLALRFAVNWAKEGRWVDICSFEMSPRQVVMRIAALEASIDLLRLRSGRLMPDEYDRYTETRNWLETAPIRIWKAAGKTSADIRNRLHSRHADGELDVAIVDYVGIVNGTGRRIDNRAQEVAAISRDLKTTAGELDIPMLALAQINREGTKSTSTKPHLSWLKDSGGQEADADGVLFLMRELESRDAVLWLSKQRNGPLGPLSLHFEAQYARYDELGRLGFREEVQEYYQ